MKHLTIGARYTGRFIADRSTPLEGATYGREREPWREALGHPDRIKHVKWIE